MRNLKPGETYRTFKGVLGHEFDSDIDNGFRPEGLIRLSETTVDNVQYIHDHGSVFDTGTAVHHLTLYRSLKSNALVWGTGMVQWVWGLDNHHDINDPQRANQYNIRVAADTDQPDPVVRQATVNMLADMGTSLSGSISTILTVLSWICVGIHMCGALPAPFCA